MKICVVAHRVRGTLRMLLKGGDSVGNGGGCWDMGKKKKDDTNHSHRPLKE